MAGMPGGLLKDVDHDVEQVDVGQRPPRHVARRVDGKLCDRRVRMLAGTLVEVDDLFAGLVRGRPQVAAVRVLPSPQRLRGGATEDLTEIPGLTGRHMLHQAKEIGSRLRRGRRMSYSDRASSFQTSASRITLSRPCRKSFAKSSIMATSLPRGNNRSRSGAHRTVASKLRTRNPATFLWCRIWRSTGVRSRGDSQTGEAASAGVPVATARGQLLHMPREGRVNVHAS